MSALVSWRSVSTATRWALCLLLVMTMGTASSELPGNGVVLWNGPKQVDLYVSDHPALLALADQPTFNWIGEDTEPRTVATWVRAAKGTSVPLVLYGHKVLEKVQVPKASAGSHLDVLPTLINLTAPRGFVYHAFGRDLLDETQPQVGYGCQAVIGPDFILKIHDPTRVEDLQGNPKTGVDGKTLALRYRQLHGLGWWRAMKGNQWPAQAQTAALKNRD